MKHKIELAAWHLNRNCNFDCSYCFAKEKSWKVGRGAELDIPAFKQYKDFEWERMVISGGEPFIYPDFVEMMGELLGFVKTVNINTNCSTSNIYDFADKINPKQVNEIDCALHLGERPKKSYPDMIEKIKYLRSRGFKTYMIQVIHPKIWKEYKEVFELFKKHGILITPKPMKAIWHLKEYPAAYKQKLREEILEYTYMSQTQSSEQIVDKCIYTINGLRGWKNIPCKAGHSGMVIHYNGDAHRCFGDKRYLGNLYAGTIKLDDMPQLCNYSVCKCDMEGRVYHKIPGLVTSKQSIKRIGMSYGVDFLRKVHMFDYVKRKCNL